MSKFARRLEEARGIHAGGDAAGAARAYAVLSREAPHDATVLHGLGVALAQTGRLAEADAALARAAALAPKAPDVQFDLGALRDAQGRPKEAEAAFRRVVEIAPGHARAWEAIGILRQAAGDFGASGEAYRRASAGAPERLDLALLAAEAMTPGEGADLLVEALERFPGDIRVLMPLAELLVRANRVDEAEATLRALRAIAPNSGLAGRQLGAIFARRGRVPDAAAALYDSIIRDPDDPEAWALLAGLRDTVGDSDGAVAAAERAVYLRPDDLRLVGTRARLAQHAGRVEAAQAGLAALPAAMREIADVRLLGGMLMPPILDSEAQIDVLRDRWMEAMADVEANPSFVASPWETVGITGYFLGYQGREDRPLMEAYARATLAASPHLAYAARSLGGGGGNRIRVGFLSAHLRTHSVGRVLLDLVAALDRTRFEVVHLQVADDRGKGRERGEAAADRTIRLPMNLEAAHAAIEAEGLDALVYTDLHLNPFSDALAHARLAPVQAATWGHPGTSGHDSLDYWVSCESWEPEGNERLYTERLARLARAPYVTARPDLPERTPDRRALGLREDARLYGLLQSPFKIHPEFDATLAAILAGDPKARILVAASPHYTWKQTLLARLGRILDVSRIDFLPTKAFDGYMAALAACDVALDPIHFGGAVTSLDAFALGLPVVTLPGGQMRGRVTAGMYRQMGYVEPIATDKDDYVELAHRFAQDRASAREAREAILDANGALFDDRAPVADFEAWLERAVSEAG